jgi:acetyl-CoA synthetase
MVMHDGGFRGSKTITLKEIIDEALENVILSKKNIGGKRTNTQVGNMKEGRDQWIQPFIR